MRNLTACARGGAAIPGGPATPYLHALPDASPAAVTPLPRDLLLLAEQPGIALQVLYGAAATGARVHVLAGPRAAHLRRSRLVASFAAADLPAEDGDAEPLRAAVEAAARRTGSALVLPGDEYSTRMLVRMAPGLAVPVFPCPPAATFWRLADKWEFYRLCREAGAPVPETIRFGRKDAATPAELGRALGYPLVIKPTDQGNSNGVVIASTAEEAARRVHDNRGYTYGTLIAQAFVPGEDIDCSVLAIEGRPIAMAVQQRVDRAIVFTRCPALTDAVARILRATRYTGVAHFDARRDERDGAIRLIECNPRFWASIEAARWCGMNFVELGIRAAAGEQDGLRILEEGTFLSWSAMARRALRLDLRPVLSESRRGLLQALADPLPVLAEELHALRRRRRMAG